MRKLFGETAKVWLAFEGKTQAKPFKVADVEYFSDQSGMSDKEIEESSWVLDLLNVQERLENGSIFALHEGISICQEQQIPLPVWLEEELKRLIAAVANGLPYGEGKKGRSNSQPARIRELVKIHLRKDTVRRIRWYQAMEPCFFGFILLPDELKKKNRGLTLPDLGNSIEAAIQHAHIALRGTFAQGSEETIRKAFFSNDDEGAYWSQTRLDALELVGNLPQGANELPAGYKVLETANTPEIIEGMIDLREDAISQKYLNFIKKNSFDTFVEMLEKGRCSEI